LLVEDGILLFGFDGFDGCANDRPQLLGQRTSPDHIVDDIRIIRYDIEVNVAVSGIRALSTATEKDHLTGQSLQLVKKGDQISQGEEDLVLAEERVAGIGGIEDQLASLLAGDESEGVKVSQGFAGSPIADVGQAADFLDEIALVRVFSQKVQCPLQIGGHKDVSHYNSRILHCDEHTFIVMNILILSRVWIARQVNKCTGAGEQGSAGGDRERGREEAFGHPQALVLYLRWGSRHEAGRHR
jgi:hypothetical protein